MSRGTVAAAFDQLQSEGYTRIQVGSGTFVASGLPHPPALVLGFVGCTGSELRRGIEVLAATVEASPEAKT